MPEPTPPLRVSARGLLSRRGVWLPSAVILGLLSFVLSLLYLGANNDPVGSTKDLPIALVDTDKGTQVGGKPIDLGAQIAAKITGAADLKEKVDWKQVDRRTADDLLARGKVFGALVIPDDFSASVAALAGPAQRTPHPPTMTVLTNPAAGSFGSSMAAEINRKVVETTSAEVGKQLGQAAAHQAAQAARATEAQAAAGNAAAGQAAAGQPASAQAASGHPASAQAAASAPGAAAQLTIADPIHVSVQEGHPLGQHSGLGLSAFFYALVLVLGGMLGANVIHMQVDTALGYAASDKGPFRIVKPLQHATRVHHFLVCSALMVVLSMLTSALAMAAAVGVIGIDASNLPMLWLFGTCATAAMGITALALLAVFGTPGPIVSMLVLIGLAVPSAGATIPIQALPDFYRFLAEFEPFRQVVDGVRSILYFGAQADAGLGRAWTMVGIGFAASLALGLVFTRLYDRRGLHRSTPHLAQPVPVG
ncbi:YhgE/Pip domain-containing protein [Streptomyces sp. NPDC004520]|uniref:YhgE/Pip domain-containing protein n=1 Tax=Streptomyces sp. NPDC004520 TaxID=3364702 RepID=UPI0036C3B25B